MTGKHERLVDPCKEHSLSKIMVSLFPKSSLVYLQLFSSMSVSQI